MFLKNGMRKIAGVALLLLPAAVYSKEKAATSINSFIKNVGQVTDENRQPRSDIDFKIGNANFSVFVSAGQLQYQWYKVQTTKKIATENAPAFLPQKAEVPVADTVELCAMWMKLRGAKRNVVPEVEEIQPYYENYYLPYCWGKKANSYNRVIYRNIYPNIDWILYVDKNSNEGFKYDFIIHSGGRVSDIQMLYEGASSLSLDESELSVVTRMGTIKEARPYTYDMATRRAIECSYVRQGDIVMFKTAKNDNIVIDPKLNWGTYFTNPNNNTGTCSAADTFGNAYLCGWTSLLTNIAIGTAPYRQFYNGGAKDCFIAQFNSAGNYVNWSTYYGGEEEDEVKAAVTDRTGSLYVTGTTASFTGVSGGGAQQDSNGASVFTTFSSPFDGFLTKFNRQGGFEWGTYVGGHGGDRAYAIVCDASNGVYVGGMTTSTDSIATPGTFQDTGGHDKGFLVKYSATTGKRQWGTFFNGQIQGVAYANNNRVYIAGYTKWYANVGTPGAFQQSYALDPLALQYASFGTNGFIVSFDANNGKRKWGTYYGRYTQSLVCDSLYNVYAGGVDSTSKQVCWPPPGFIVKLDSNGIPKWRTYYPVHAFSAALSPDNKIYLGGSVLAFHDITTPDGLLPSRVATEPPYPACPFEEDNFLAKFDNNDGKLLYGTYYGGHSMEFLGGISYGTTGDSGKIYLGSGTYGYDHISTPNGYQPDKFDTSGYTGYLAQFQTDTNVYIRFPYIDTLLCAGGPLNIRYGVTNLFRPGNKFTVQLSDSNGIFTSPVNLGSITYNAHGEIACTIPSGTLPATGYRIRIVSSLPADTFYCYDRTIRISEYYYPKPFAPQPICANLFVTLFDSSHISPPLGVKYTWLSPNPNRHKGQLPTYYINPLVLADSGYHVLIADNYGCVRKDSVHVHITVAPPEPTITGDTSLCIGDTLMLTASSPVPGVVFSWFDPANNWRGDSVTIKTPNVSFSDSGKYRIAAVLNGCQSDPQYGQIITVHPLPKPTATNTGPVCAGEELKLNATDTITNVTYTWSSSNGSFSHNKKDTTIKNAGTALSGQYTVKTRTIHGCENTAVTNVTVKPLPNDPDTRSNSPVCTRTALQLLSTATNAATYSWTGPNGFTSAQQSPVLPNSTPGMQGRYILVVDLDGCKKADTTEVQIDQSPDTPQLSSNSPLQTGKTLELKIGNKQSGVNYTWSGPNFSSNEAEPKLPNVIPANSGVYTATAISGKCIAQDTIHIVVKDETGKDPKEPVVIFPNPNNGSFRITGETQTAGDVELGVYASDGKRVYKATITPQNNKIEADVNIGGVSAGVYRLKIRIDGKATGLSFTVGR